MRTVHSAALINSRVVDDRLRVDINPRARRISLRVDTARGCVVLVRPKRCSDALVAAFVADKRGWIDKHLAAMPEQIALVDGVGVSVLGEVRTITHSPTAKRGVWVEGDNIFVSGPPEHVTRRVKDWLKAEARKTFAEWARDYAATLNVKVARVAVRDTTSRWGSCTRDGRLSLSWRLIFAPREVAAYVVAHEVAHLKHMDHSASFWRVVATLAGDIKTPRAWLRRNGGHLHRFI